MNCVGGGADKYQSRLLAGPGKVRVLAEKAVSRVDGAGAAGFGRPQNVVLDEVGFIDRTGPDADRLVGQLHMGCPRVRLGVNGDRAVTLGTGGADNPAGNLTAIGDQYAGKSTHRFLRYLAIGPV